MKELSIEEKAKAYDEAIEKAKEYFNSPRTCFDIEQLCNIFPELTESEDEKIRKAIVWCIDTIQGELGINEPEGLPISKLKSWLEKQGDSYTKKDVDDAYLKGISDAKNEFKKQYKANYQIRKDIATFIFNYRGDIKDRAKWMNYLGIKVSFAEEQGEKKPVNRLKTTAGNWYVCEMEVMNENMTTAFHCGEVYYCPKDGYIDVNGALFEVGTLDIFRLATKEEIPQQKQEWSEEDESMLYGVMETERYMLDVVNGIKKFDVGNGDIRKACEEELNWLKHLKDRYTWKPSEEQLEAINTAINVIGKGTLNGKELIGLLEQLKAL